jgi:hypothetical protein
MALEEIWGHLVKSDAICNETIERSGRSMRRLEISHGRA